MAKRTAAAGAVEAAAEALTAAAKAAADDASDGAGPAKDLGPLFSFDGEQSELHDRTRVYRVEPVDEGHLDDIPPDADARDIKRRWGGGVYKVQAVTARGKIIATDGNIKIAGDPLFENEVSRKRYHKWLAQQFPTVPVDPGSHLRADDDVADAKHRRELERIRAEVEAKEQAAERQRQRERAEREAERERQAEERKRERDERMEAEERRWRETREERKAEREEREALEERRWKAEMEERRAEREHRQDPTEMLLRGVQLAVSMGGGGSAEYPDAGTAFVAKLPEIFAGAKDLATSAGLGGNQNPKPKALPARQAPGGEKLEIEGPLRDKVMRTGAAIKKAGGNPEAVISAAMAKALDDVTPKAAPRPAAVKVAKPAPRTKGRR